MLLILSLIAYNKIDLCYNCKVNLAGITVKNDISPVLCGLFALCVHCDDTPFCNPCDLQRKATIITIVRDNLSTRLHFQGCLTLSVDGIFP